jgi:hypothetical protein
VVAARPAYTAAGATPLLNFKLLPNFQMAAPRESPMLVTAGDIHGHSELT